MQSFMCCVISLPANSFYNILILSLLFLNFRKKCFSSSSSQKKKLVKKSICPSLPPQGHRSLAVCQPPGAGHPQRLSHVRQHGLDRPVAPRGRRSHGGFARSSSGFRTGTKHTWSRRTERTGHIEQTQILTQTNSSSRA